MQSGLDYFGQVLHEHMTAVYFSQLLCQLLFNTPRGLLCYTFK